jgi:two-component system cell cycle response regulator DivK
MANELILIVEDNDKNLKLLRDVLGAKGYTTIESITAEEGIELARQQHPDLILMDIELPGIDGITAFKQLRADPVTQSIPIVAVTASVMPTDRRRILGAGFDAYITKPISVKDFLVEVRSLLDRNSPGEGA